MRKAGRHIEKTYSKALAALFAADAKLGEQGGGTASDALRWWFQTNSNQSQFAAEV